MRREHPAGAPAGIFCILALKPCSGHQQRERRMSDMINTLRWTSADLDVLPDNGTRYEIIEGELFMSKQPHYHHQLTCSNVTRVVGNWSIQTGLGQTVGAPGIIFTDDEDVAPDVVWCSYERLETILSDDGKFHGAPELVIEVLSPGSANERRDRQAKLKLYSRRGVQEYWILNWLAGQAEIYRRRRHALRLIETLNKQDTLTSPLLPGFSCPVADLFDYPRITPSHQPRRRGRQSKR
jgi:Uma2 family endonuclease